ncbi:MAG: DUF308 domain-containing protein [Bacteroidales bacterium]|nr:DUF308 domain-containing protein [Bacteroidales bacterium]
MMKTVKRQNWTFFLFSGIIAILYAFAAIFLKEQLIFSIVWYTGLLVLIAGLILLYSSIRQSMRNLPYVVSMVQSLLMLVFALILLFMTRNSIAAFVILLGIWIILTSLYQAYLLINNNPVSKSKSAAIISVITTLIFGIIMVFNPFSATGFLVVVSGVFALLSGSLLIWFAFVIKGSNNPV